MDELDALLELRLFVLVRRLQRALEIVEDREQLLDQPLVRKRDVFRALTRGPLLVVLEVGSKTQQPVVFDDLGRCVLLLLVVLDLLVGHYDVVFASSSTTSYSPSSTTSSSAVGAPSPLADACACAVACAYTASASE